MADNVTANPGAGGPNFAADDIGGVYFPRTKLVLGADGVNGGDVSSANPLPVTGPLTDAQLRATAVPTSISDSAATTSFGPIVAANAILFSAIDTSHERTVVLQLSGLWSGSVGFQQSNDGTTWWDANGLSQSHDIGLVSSVYAPDAITVQVAARFFRAVTSADFSGSVSGTYVLRAVEPPQVAQNVRLMDVDPAATFQIAAIDQNNALTRVRANNFGHLVLADNVTRTDFRSSVGTIVQLETTGYNSISVQLFAQVAFTATIAFQASNDGTNWNAVAAWAVSPGAAPTSTVSTVGQWLVPVVGRFFRVQVVAYTSGVIGCVSALKSQNAWFPFSSPSFAANSSVNVAQIGGSAPVTGGVAGIQAIGGNIAVGAAPTANPVPIGGWDGTNTRRILTDAVSGGVALGAAGVSNGASVSTLISAATNNLTQLKATLGKVFIIDIQNTVASIRYLKLFNLPSASVTMGTTSATLNFSIPASGKLTIVTDLGINLGGTGISYALTGGSALTDNTAIGAGDLICNFQFV